MYIVYIKMYFQKNNFVKFILLIQYKLYLVKLNE